MSLLDEIRNDLLNETASLSNTLRKAKVVASQIGLPEFRDWVDFELGGYPDGADVPDYRSFIPTNLGMFSGPFQSSATNVPIPTYDLPDIVKEFAQNMVFVEGVGQLEAMGEGGSQRKWPPEFVIAAREHLEYSGGYVLIDVHQPVPAHLTLGIVDQIKNKLLDFMLSLQEHKITLDSVSDEIVAPEVVRNLFNINIYGDSNVVASGENVHQDTSGIVAGDIDSLTDHFRHLGIAEDDLAALQAAVEADPGLEGRGFGAGVRQWLGSMVSKAASGAIDIGVEQMSRSAVDALSAFYE